MELRQQGGELHEAGNHAGSVKVLGEARTLWGSETQGQGLKKAI